MDQLQPSDLKTILHSKRANIYYLEHCRVLVNGGRVEYVTQQGSKSLYWNIPIANTSTILLGTGTSITQAAVRELAKAGVPIGFAGGGGTPLFAANELDFEVSWLTPQSEYRPTEYLQRWVAMWFNEEARLSTARALQRLRSQQIRRMWSQDAYLRSLGFVPERQDLNDAIAQFEYRATHATDTTMLLLAEAKLTKRLYAIAVHAVGYGDFSRSKAGASIDAANRFLDHGNYLAYGLAATATWVLGLPHALAVLHGKTRRGALVFDVADLIKDSIILPLAFVAAMRGDEDQQFRVACLDALTRTEALDFMIESLQQVAVGGSSTP